MNHISHTIDGTYTLSGDALVVHGFPIRSNKVTVAREKHIVTHRAVNDELMAYRNDSEEHRNQTYSTNTSTLPMPSTYVSQRGHLTQLAAGAVFDVSLLPSG